MGSFTRAPSQQTDAAPWQAQPQSKPQTQSQAPQPRGNSAAQDALKQAPATPPWQDPGQSVDPSQAAAAKPNAEPAADPTPPDQPQGQCVDPNQPAPSKKLEASDPPAPPDPKLEADEQVLRYRWLEREKRYQVTKYDPKKTRFGENGRPLTGPTVQLMGREVRMDDAIQAITGHADATYGAVQKLEDTPFGTGIVLAASECAPVYGALLSSKVHLALASAHLAAGKDDAAKASLKAGVAAYNDACRKLRVARLKIQNNVELTIGLLSAVQAAGEVAEIVLVFTGAGAAAKAVGSALEARKAATWLVKAGELVTAATIKGGYSAADTVRDTLVYKPGEPIDWAKFGTTWLKSGLTTLLSDGIAEGLKVGLASIYNFKGAAALPDLHKLASEVAGNLTASLLSTVAGLVTDAAASGNKDTSGKLLTRALDKNPDKTQELFLKINKKIIDDIQGGAVSVAADHLTEALLKKDGAQKLLNLIKTVLAKK